MSLVGGCPAHAGISSSVPDLRSLDVSYLSPFPGVTTQNISRYCQISLTGQNWASQMYTIFIHMIFEQLSALRREGRRQLTSKKHPLHSGHGVLFCLFILFLATLGLCCCVQVFPSCREPESRCGAWASHRSGFSWWEAWSLGLQ